jgi:tetratricopeptide (TPR) repeat protein
VKLQSLREALLNAKQGYWADQVEIQRRAAAAWTARAEGKNDDALALMRTAVELESSTEEHPVTPGALVPAREMLGEMLLELNQPTAARDEFEASLRAEPNRLRGVYGAARAAELLAGDLGKAKLLYGRLVALTMQADTERPEIQKAKAFMAKP